MARQPDRQTGNPADTPLLPKLLLFFYFFFSVVVVIVVVVVSVVNWKMCAMKDFKNGFLTPPYFRPTVAKVAVKLYCSAPAP